MEARNHWQPVTEIYKEIVAPMPASEIDDDPMTLIEAARRARRMTEVKVPFGITAITGIFFARAAIYALFAAKLFTSPDTLMAGWITAHCPSIIPLGFTVSDRSAMAATMAEALGVMAVLSLGIAILWLLRWRPVLFISLAMSGYFLAHIVISYFKIAGLGDPNLFGTDQLDVIVIESGVNLLTFLFIALYPDLKHTFQRHF